MRLASRGGFFRRKVNRHRELRTQQPPEKVDAHRRCGLNKGEWQPGTCDAALVERSPRSEAKSLVSKLVPPLDCTQCADLVRGCRAIAQRRAATIGGGGGRAWPNRQRGNAVPILGRAARVTTPPPSDATVPGGPDQLGWRAIAPRRGGDEMSVGELDVDQWRKPVAVDARARSAGWP